MNNEEQTLIDGLFAKLKQAESNSAPRDAQAEARIKEHLAQQPGAPYYMAQAILVQEAAVNQLNRQVQQLQAELRQARAQPASAPAQGGGGFLSSIFGSGAREPTPPPRPSSFSRQPGDGWRDGPSSPPPYSPPSGQAPAGRGFLGGALQTAAGVAGGVLLAEGISSLFHHSQPQEIVEVIEQAPNPTDTADQTDGGWGDDQQRVADNGDWSSDQGGFTDTDYDDGGSTFDDDDSFV